MADPANPVDAAFCVQLQVRLQWRRHLNSVAPLRPALHRYCSRLTGNIWDGEDLAQDTLMRVLSLMGRLDADLENPRGYLIRTATTLWIDRTRRRTLDREYALRQRANADTASTRPPDPAHSTEVRGAASELLQRLPPRERAAVLLKEVFDLSLEETASVLKTTVRDVEAALDRGRGRLQAADRESPSALPPPSHERIERFVKALGARDIGALRPICSADLGVELVGGAEADVFERNKTFFQHAHMVLPQLGFGENPHWTTIECDGEPMALGEHLGIVALDRTYRSSG